MKNLSVAVLVILVAAACGGSVTRNASDPTADESGPPSATTDPSPVAEASGAVLPPLEDIAYGDDDRHELDIYLPDADGPHPTILAIHGGAFRTRSKDFYNRIGPLFAERGYAFVAINYRLVPSHTYPAQVEDAFCALAWLHANHERYGFDPARVAAWGGSAGGYLAAMLGTVDDPERFLDGCAHDSPTEPALNAVAVFYGLFDFTDISDYPTSGIPTLTQFWGAQHDELSAQQLADMSPIEQIDGSEPPFILLHGTEDITIPSIMSERFAAALADPASKWNWSSSRTRSMPSSRCCGPTRCRRPLKRSRPSSANSVPADEIATAAGSLRPAGRSHKGAGFPSVAWRGSHLDARLAQPLRNRVQ